MMNKRYIIDKLGAFLYQGPSWEVNPKLWRGGHADAPWRTGIAAFCYPEHRKKFLEFIKSCDNNGKFWRHPEHTKDDFSRDQYIMSVSALAIYEPESLEKFFKPKLKLSKRFNISPSLYFWRKLLSAKNKYAIKLHRFLYTITSLINLNLNYFGWFLHRTLKFPKFLQKYIKTGKLRPPYFAFHLHSWMFFTAHKTGKIDMNGLLGKESIKQMEFLNKKVDSRNYLMELLLTNKSNTQEPYISFPHKNITNFMWQNLVPWTRMSDHVRKKNRYENIFFNTMENEDYYFSYDILSSEIFN